MLNDARGRRRAIFEHLFREGGLLPASHLVADRRDLKFDESGDVKAGGSPSVATRKKPVERLAGGNPSAAKLRVVFDAGALHRQAAPPRGGAAGCSRRRWGGAIVGDHRDVVTSWAPRDRMFPIATLATESRGITLNTSKTREDAADEPVPAPTWGPDHPPGKNDGNVRRSGVERWFAKAATASACRIGRSAAPG